MKRTKLPNRLQNAVIDYLPGQVWRLWLHTVDWKHGTYMLLYSDGRIDRVTEYEEGTDVVCIAPAGEK